jgi:hypothetical protein
MKTLALATILVLSLLAAPLAVEAQQAGKVWRIGLLSPESLQPGLLEEFRDELRKLGYVEGRMSSSKCDTPRARPSDLLLLQTNSYSAELTSS